MLKHYRCTRNEVYETPNCPGFNHLPARQGHYISAPTRAEALAEMARRFPHDLHGFTAHDTGERYDDNHRPLRDEEARAKPEVSWRRYGHIFAEMDLSTSKYTGRFFVIFDCEDREQATELLCFLLPGPYSVGESGQTAISDTDETSLSWACLGTPQLRGHEPCLQETKREDREIRWFSRATNWQ